jgi:hypothetical protein
MDLSNPSSGNPLPGAFTGKTPLGNNGHLFPMQIDSDSAFSRIHMKKWFALDAYPSTGDNLPLNLGDLANAEVISGFTQSEREFLTNNGFVVVPTQEDQFADLRENVSRRFGQPYYLTTDASFHALHLTFDELLRSLKREMLRPRLINMIQSVFDEAKSELMEVRGKAIEKDCLLASAYLGVALKLLDPQSEIPASLREIVNAQVEQVLAGGQSALVLFPDMEEDFSCFQPAGYYAGDPRLETYYRGMTWLEQIKLKLNGPYARVSLLITYALRRAKTPSGTKAAEEWVHIYDMLNFLVGPGDNVGPVEYANLMDRVYEKDPSLDILADETRWNMFKNRLRELPIPHISSTYIDFSLFNEDQRGWCFMSQRVTLDIFTLENLVDPKVPGRVLPSGLDIGAVWGSKAALNLLAKEGQVDLAGFTDHLNWMKLAVEDQFEAQWLRSFYSGWLYTFLPQLAEKGLIYPPYMRTSAWSLKELNSTLGSWVELRHETVLYTRMPETPRGGYSTTPLSGPAPGYVEPNPLVFYRLAYLTQALSEGMMNNINQARLDPPAEGDFSASVGGVLLMIFRMADLAKHFERLGDIAAKELMGKSPSSSDWQAIQTPLSMIESEVLYSRTNNAKNPMELPLIPKLITVASNNKGEALEAGLGKVDRIYVVVPLDGKLYVAQGGVYAYRQFTCPASTKPTDAEWRQNQVTNTRTSPDWSGAYTLAGGKSTDVMIFRRSDIYRVRDGISPAVFQSASLESVQKGSLQPGWYISLAGGGPLVADGINWWQIYVEVGDNRLDEGWIVEDQGSYTRAG